MTFEFAEITPENEPQEVQVSSNELVFMIGESVVRDRQNLKRLQFLDKQVGLAREEALKAQSLAMAAEQKNVTLEKGRDSLNERIVQLENQVHDTAIERDKFRNELLAITNKKPKRLVKGVKHAANSSRY